MEIIKRVSSIYNERYKFECPICNSILIAELKELNYNGFRYSFLCPVCGRTGYIFYNDMEKVDD